MNLSKRTLRSVVIGLMVAALPMVALATDTFSDVADDAFYHDQVNNIAGAGVTSGCGAATYCPGNPVSRGEMAVFLNRTGGRVALGSNETPVVLTQGGQSVVSLDITPPGTAAGTNMIQVTGAASVTCLTACTAGFALTDGTDASRTAVVTRTVAGTTNVPLSWVHQVPGGASKTYHITGATINDGVTAIGDISAYAVLFGPDGGNDLSPTP